MQNTSAAIDSVEINGQQVKLPQVGFSFYLTRDVERGNGIMIPKGTTGIVTRIEEDGNCIWGKLDTHIPFLDEWDNELQWYSWDQAEQHAAMEFWGDVTVFIRPIAAPAHPKL